MSIENSHWSKVGVRISSLTVTPEQVTEITGLQPSEQYHIGEHIKQNSSYAALDKHLWMLDSGLPDDATVESKLYHLIDKIRFSHSEVSIGFWVTMIPAYLQDGISFSPDLIEGLSRTSANLEITILVDP